MRASRTALLFASVWLLPGLASAQTVAKGFQLSPYAPSERGSDWFAADSLDLRGKGRLAVGVIGDLSLKPLTFRRDGTEVGSPVKQVAVAHVGASVVAADRLRLALNVPVMLAASGENTAFSPGVILPGAKKRAVSDVRGSVDARLFGRYGEGLTAAVGAAVYVPTNAEGGRAAYASDGSARVEPRFSLARSVPSGIELAASMGVRISKKPDTDYANRPGGTGIVFAAAAGKRFASGKLLIGPELYGVTGTAKPLQRESSPIEAILSARYQASSTVRLGAAVGTGLTTGFGASALRALGTIEVMGKVVVNGDRDGDGILDEVDACPDQAGVKSDDPKRHGCPAGDRDADGVLDEVDACPDEPGKRSDDPKKNGCPDAPKDRDKDGVLDAVDACPDEPGVRSDDPKKNGCPDAPKDRDKDGIPDDSDACPDQAGPKDSDPKKNGCPAVRVEGGQIKILEQVKFKTGSSVILPESDGILTAVTAVLKEHAEIKKVRVEGHTDSKGAAGANKALSQARAASVVKWLVSHGIDSKRLYPKGFGQERPIDSNDTDAGRQNNRRVEFHIDP
ncbi:MAG: OmpA family protein [Polyangiaceae bacterium]|nr:OmpA family protein [Polyangiaceae bacterium]